MRKLLLLLAISLIVFGCQSKKSDDPKLLALLKSKIIPKEKAEAMKKAFKDAGNRPSKQTNFEFHWDVYKNVIGMHGDKDLYIVPVTYSKADEKEYREAWNLSETDSSGYVEGYSSFVIQSGTNTYYYQFVKICPPPDGLCNTRNNADQ